MKYLNLTYNELIKVFNNETIIRNKYHIKYLTKKLYPDSFNVNDFVICIRVSITYYDYILKFEVAVEKNRTRQRLSQIRLEAKDKFPDIYKDCDFYYEFPDRKVNRYRFFTYQHLVDIFKNGENPIRFYSKYKAKELYPDLFDINDFKRKKHICHKKKYSYQELLDMFNNSKDGYTRGWIKEVAKKRDEYNEDDFVKIRTRINYDEKVKEYNNESIVRKRSNIKQYLKKHLPDKFNEGDFVKNYKRSKL